MRRRARNCGALTQGVDQITMRGVPLSKMPARRVARQSLTPLRRAADAHNTAILCKEPVFFRKVRDGQISWRRAKHGATPHHVPAPTSCFSR
jgi:hypothetical protein